MEITIQGDVILNLTPNEQELRSVHKIRTSAAMSTFKKKVKATDSVCQCCGDDANGHLEVHHIMPLSKYKELGVDEGNGIALCQKCHRKYHETYSGSENAVTFSKFMRDFGNRRYGGL